MAEALLEARGLAKRFGGLTAVDGVSLTLEAGRIHAVIGPNGAGKTTLVNLLSGELRPSAGSIRVDGEEIAGLSPERVARRGIARSYQRVNLFPEFTAFENCRLAAQAQHSGRLETVLPARGARHLAAEAEQALALVGFDDAGRITGELSHGEQRQLEIAMTLATAPRVLLLDEPLAGLGAEESRAMADLIARVAPGRAVLLVEHDMDAVFRVASTLTVMADGKVLASGSPEAIRDNAAVQEAYLGAAEAGP